MSQNQTKREFIVGDVAMLQSGGELMTIAVTDGAAAVCLWHDKQGLLQTQRIPVVALRRPRWPSLKLTPYEP